MRAHQAGTGLVRLSRHRRVADLLRVHRAQPLIGEIGAHGRQGSGARIGKVLELGATAHLFLSLVGLLTSKSSSPSSSGTSREGGRRCNWWWW